MIIFWILLLMSFAGTIYVIPRTIRRLREEGHVVKDMYKPGKPLIPTNAGIIILFTSYISIALLPIIVRFINLTYPTVEGISDLSETNMAILLVVSVYALYGLVDDLVVLGRKAKTVLPIAFGYPLISVTFPVSVWIPITGNFDLTGTFFWDLEWTDIFRITIIPIYVMVVANLVNMHSGYNGLQSGLSILVLLAIIIKTHIDGNLDLVFPVGAFIGSMLAFWCFNKFPSKLFEGNIGSMLFGSLIGSIIVVQEYWWFGFFILIPHTFNFLLWVVWLIMVRTDPKNYLESDNAHRKFGDVDSKGNITVPNRLTLKWIPNYYFKLNEKSSVNLMYLLTSSFCIVGLFIF